MACTCCAFDTELFAPTVQDKLRSLSMFMSDRLISIDLSKSTVTDRHIESLVVGATALEVVILADCPNITNSTFRHLSLCLAKTLRHVNVSRNANIDFEGLAWFGAS